MKLSNRIKKILLFACLPTLLATTFLFFTYGNPQWGKYIYIWQAFVLPQGRHIEADEDYYLQCPDDFTGQWKTWYENGQLRTDGLFVDGEIRSNRISFYKNGNLASVHTYIYTLKGWPLNTKMYYKGLPPNTTLYYEDGLIHRTTTRYHGISRYDFKWKYNEINGFDIEQYTHNHDSGFQLEFYKNGKRKSVEKFRTNQGNSKITIVRDEIQKYWDEGGKLEAMFYYKTNGDCVLLFSSERNTDLRHEYKKEIKKFETDLKGFQKRYNLQAVVD